MDIWKGILEFSTALLTPVLAVFGAFILFNQYRLEKQRWRLALYDKRYPVFLSTMQYITYVVQRSSMTNEVLFSFLRNSKDMEFLFGDDVKNRLQLLYQKGLDLKTIEAKLEKMPNGAEKNALVDQSSEVFSWFADQYEICTELFGRYLRVDDKSMFRRVLRLRLRRRVT